MTVEIISTLAPIESDQALPLRATLKMFHNNSPFADVPGTHTVRFVVMNSLGTGDRTRRLRLRPARLLFSAVVDGPLDAWLWGLFEKQSYAADRVWHHCIGWPATGDWTARARWLLDQRLATTYEVVAHDVTVAEIERGLALQRVLRDLATLEPTLKPSDLRAAYHRAVAGVAR